MRNEFASLNRILVAIGRAARQDDLRQPFGPPRIRFRCVRWSGTYLEIVLGWSRFTLGVNCFGDPFFDIERCSPCRMTTVCYGTEF